MSSLSHLRLQSVTLVVSDLVRSMRFYGPEGLGLEPMGADELGAGGRVLVRLVEQPSAGPSNPRALGLFHFALLLPSRADLGSFFGYARETLPLGGAADHLVSEALYLSDPDGHGIEVYADRPREAWRQQHGEVVMSTEGLDEDGVLGAALQPWHGMPPGTTLGHVHLRVGALGTARTFFSELLGLDLTLASYPGAFFFAADGYHHHVGTNVWSSRGGHPASADTCRLIRISASVGNRESFDAAYERLSEGGAEPTRATSDLFTVRDVAGVEWALACES